MLQVHEVVVSPLPGIPPEMVERLQAAGTGVEAAEAALQVGHVMQGRVGQDREAAEAALQVGHDHVIVYMTRLQSGHQVCVRVFRVGPSNRP